MWQCMPRVARHPRHGRSSYTSAALHMRRRAPHALACSRYNKSGLTMAQAGCLCSTARHPRHGRASYTSARSFTRVAARRTHSPAAAAVDQARRALHVAVRVPCRLASIAWPRLIHQRARLMRVQLASRIRMQPPQQANHGNLQMVSSNL